MMITDLLSGFIACKKYFILIRTINVSAVDNKTLGTNDEISY